MFKKTAAALSFSLAALGMAGGAGAQSSTFLFNPAGTGAAGAVTASSIDWLQGNVLAVNGIAAVSTGAGALITDLYQANLDSFVNGSTTVFTNGGAGGTQNFTALASFSEYVTFATVSGTNGIATFDNTFGALPNTNTLPSFFEICAQSSLATDLTGAGFACANPILTGTLQDLVGVSPTGTDFASSVLLDQSSNGDQWSGQLTHNISGATNIFITVNFANPGYFPDLTAGTTLVLAQTNTSFIDPFNEQDPSYCFSSNGTTSSTSGTTVCSAGTQQAFGTLGPINGGNPTAPFGGPNFIFQADANTSFQRTIPEPGTLALFGLGLAIASALARSRKKI